MSEFSHRKTEHLDPEKFASRTRAKDPGIEAHIVNPDNKNMHKPMPKVGAMVRTSINGLAVDCKIINVIGTNTISVLIDDVFFANHKLFLKEKTHIIGLDAIQIYLT